MKSSMFAAAAVLTVAMAGVAVAQAPGPYTEAQATRARTTYEGTCALCHGVDLTGGPGSPGLVGPEFQFGWKGKTAAELFDYVKANMPPGQGGALSDQDYADVTALILKHNGAPAGTAELKPDPAALKAAAIPSR